MIVIASTLYRINSVRKVANATLRTELTNFKMVDTLQWTRLHPDYQCGIKVSQCDTYLQLCMEGMRMQGGW